VLGTIEYDHADIYKSLDEVVLQFKRLVNIVPQSGHIVCCWESENVKEAVSKSFSMVEPFGFSSECFWKIASIEISPSWTEFDLYRDGRFLKRFRMKLPGRYNILNATASIAVSLENSIELNAVARALESFEGTKRRFEIIGSCRNMTIIDDFAHHPTAIRETLKAAREKYPSSRIWALFEPRSWSMRRNVFEHELATSFADADEIIIASVYRAEQLAEAERLDVGKVVSKLKQSGKKAAYINEGVDAIVKKLIEELCEGDVVIMMSNGSFDSIYGKLLDKLSRKT